MKKGGKSERYSTESSEHVLCLQLVLFLNKKMHFLGFKITTMGLSAAPSRCPYPVYGTFCELSSELVSENIVRRLNFFACVLQM